LVRLFKSFRSIAVIALICLFGGLSACGPEGEDQSSEVPVEPTLPDEELAAEAQILTEEDAPEFPTGFGEETLTPNSTTALSHNPADDAEDLYRRGFYREAIEAWEVAAEQGDAYAAYRLGVEYYDGQIIDRDIPLAARYQQMASELGNAAAMFELASFYEQGLGVRPSVEQAAAWYLESARRGYPPAQHNIATMFEDGAGVEQDFVQAYVFYSLALEQGFRVNFVQNEASGDAIFMDPRDRLQESLTAEELAAAEAQLEAFSPIE